MFLQNTIRHESRLPLLGGPGKQHSRQGTEHNTMQPPRGTQDICFILVVQGFAVQGTSEDNSLGILSRRIKTSRQLNSYHSSSFAGDLGIWKTSLCEKLQESLLTTPKITGSVEEGSSSHLSWRMHKPVKFRTITTALTSFMPLE